jgi:MFS family permease
LWTGQAIALVGFYAFNITVVLWVGAVVAAGESWAPVAVSGVLICAVAPVLVVGPIAGVYVDRWDRRRTMMATDLIRALLAVSLVPLSIMDDSVPVAGQLWARVESQGDMDARSHTACPDSRRPGQSGGRLGARSVG